MNNDKLKGFLASFDVIILGACEDKRIYKMLPANKIYFHNGEHYWKKFNTPLSFCKRVARTVELKKRYKNIQPHLLANSSYLANEFYKLKIPHGKIFKFGYFPPINEDVKIIENKRDNSVLFAGRLLKWKRPNFSIDVINKLVNTKKDYTLHIIGEGEMKNKLQRMVHKKKMEEFVVFEGFLNHDEIIAKMINSSIFIFSSNHEEGWGAVLNESLSCGCIVFASQLAGATNFLIKNEINGFVFKTKKELYKKIECFLNLTNEERYLIRLNAFNSVNGLWNEKIAASRLYSVCAALFDGHDIPSYDDGPMSLIL